MSNAVKAAEATNDAETTETPDTTKTDAVEAPEPSYTLRELQARDVFSMAQIINRIGFREFKKILDSDDVRDAIAAAKDDEDGTVNVEAVGLQVVLDVVGVVMDNLPKAEQEIYSLLSSLSDIPAKEIQTMGMVEFVSMVIDVLKKPEFGDFIKVASKLTR